MNRKLSKNSNGCLSEKLLLRIAVLYADNASAYVRARLAVIQRQILDLVQRFARSFRVALSGLIVLPIICSIAERERLV